MLYLYGIKLLSGPLKDVSLEYLELHPAASAENETPGLEPNAAWI